MNIDDIQTDEIQMPREADMLDQIFKYQTELAKKYGPIETKNGFFHPPERGLNLDDPQNQNWIKNMFWRATEEIAEAFECTDGWPDFVDPMITDSDPNTRHFLEEIIDALHFLVEVSVYVALSPAPLDTIWARARDARSEVTRLSHVRTIAFSFIKEMGLAANCLKNKPWKNSHMPTDIPKFRQKVVDAWSKFFEMWAELGMGMPDLYVLYIKKNRVNQFRQNTNY